MTPSDFPKSPMLPGTGINLGDRMTQFRLDPGHVNALEPGKRPRITPHAVIVFKDGEFFMAFSTPGGDMQAQALVQVFLKWRFSAWTCKTPSARHVFTASARLHLFRHMNLPREGCAWNPTCTSRYPPNSSQWDTCSKKILFGIGNLVPLAQSCLARTVHCLQVLTHVKGRPQAERNQLLLKFEFQAFVSPGAGATGHVVYGLEPFLTQQRCC